MINRREWWCNGVWLEVLTVNLYHFACVKASFEKRGNVIGKNDSSVSKYLRSKLVTFYRY